MVDLAILAGIAIVFIVVSLLPPFRVSVIEVSGQKKLNPAYVVDRAKQALRTPWFGILPQSAYLYLNANRLAQSLRETINPTVPLEALTVKKIFPKTIRIVIREREPAAILVTDSGNFFLDANGVITVSTTEADPAYPRIDETNKLLAIQGDVMLNPTILTALPSLSTELERMNLGPVHFQTMPVQCPFNTEANESSSEQETLPEALNANLALVNAPLNVNEDFLTPRAIPRSVCDRKQELAKTTELAVLTSEGWKLLIDARRPVGETCAALTEVLNETLLVRTGLQQIDLRFLPRVYYK